MKTTACIASVALLAFLGVGAGPAAAAPQLVEAPFSIAAECTTEPTDFGARKSCSSDWTSFPAPEGYWISKDSVKAEYTSAAGSENSIEIVYENMVPIIPGVADSAFPKIIKVRVHARSPKGLSPKRGWSKAVVTGRMFSVG